MIKLQVVGHLGKDCVTNNVNGKTVMNFSVAHSEKYKDSQGVLKERTTWVDCAYWSDRTAVAPYLKKGTLVYVEGAPEVKSFQKNDGSTGTSLSVRVLNVQLLGGTNRENNGENTGGNNYNQSTAPRSAVPATDMTDSTDDLPF